MGEATDDTPPPADITDRVFLVVVDETEEMKVALRFACLRARRTGHLVPGKELEGRRIRRLFGLYEHRDDLLNCLARAPAPGAGAEQPRRPLNVINRTAKFKRHVAPSPCRQLSKSGKYCYIIVY